MNERTTKLSKSRRRKIRKYFFPAEVGLLFLAVSPSIAATNSWSSAGGQGIYEHRISNLSGYTLGINDGTAAGLSRDEPCWLTFEASELSLPKQFELNIFVDGQTLSFLLNDGETNTSTKTEREELLGLVNALVATKKSAFTVEIPKFGLSATFSTKNAKTVLRDIGDCF